MNKCEWKDGEFFECRDYKINYSIMPNGVSMAKVRESYHEFLFCPYCGADIYKPEPVVTIEQSGGTKVINYKGIDYLLIKGNKDSKGLRILDIGLSFTPDGIEELINSGVVKPISEIKITDEIAKLRPMVVIEDQDYPFKLFGISGCCCIVESVHSGGGHCRYAENVRLATVHDLKESK